MLNTLQEQNVMFLKGRSVVTEGLDIAEIGSAVIIRSSQVNTLSACRKSKAYSSWPRTQVNNACLAGIIVEILCRDTVTTTGNTLDKSSVNYIIVNVLYLEAERHALLDSPKLTSTGEYLAISPHVS